MDEEEEDVRARTTAKAAERKSGRVILNTRELTEQIHMPTVSFSASSPFFTPLICLLLLLFLPLSSVSSLTSISPN